ncbi:hypothetical protein VTK26DRAFT_2554 [Humicola hyalothermophila]
MALQRAALLWTSCSLAAALLSMAMAQSIPLEFCASVNTANMDPLNSPWQSEGRCFDNCTDLQYALAIIQNHNCWCSNYIPHRADQKPLQDCQLPCPGYPSDYCGGDGVFGYLEVAGHAPSGTASPGGDTPISSPADSPSSTQLVETVTVGGTVRTVTATPEATGAHDPDLGAATQGGGLGGGAIAGIVIGVIAALLLLAVIIWLFFVKRRRRDDGGVLDSPMRGGGSPATPSKMGELSEGGVFGVAAPPRAQTWDSAKRRSHLMPVDPRLDPFAKGIYPGGAAGVAGGDPNASRESFESLQDNQDYSRRVHDPPRVLRAVNPDPDDD